MASEKERDAVVDDFLVADDRRDTNETAWCWSCEQFENPWFELVESRWDTRGISLKRPGQGRGRVLDPVCLPVPIQVRQITGQESLSGSPHTRGKRVLDGCPLMRVLRCSLEATLAA